jgi:hypothetical protein
LPARDKAISIRHVAFKAPSSEATTMTEMKRLIKPAVNPGSEPTAQFTVNNLSLSKMPNSSRRPKAEGRTETLVRTNISIAASGARDMERAEVTNEAGDGGSSLLDLELCLKPVRGGKILQ